MEPGVQSVEEYVDEIGTRELKITRVAERCVQLMAPRFAVGVVTSEQMWEVFCLGFAERTCIGRNGIVLVGDFCSGKDVMAFYELNMPGGHAIECLFMGREIHQG